MRRFLPLPRLDRLPTAPQPVEGVFRYHGEVVPVLRLGVLLDLVVDGAAGGGETGLYAPLILITWQGRPTALLVDQVHGDVALPAEERLASDPSLSFNGCAAGAFPDRVTGRAGTVTLLDPDRLLSEAEGRLLDAFRAAEERRLARWEGAA
ncbi:chemotaxis protein CheW [Azospirillum sp. BE72]|uniref:chemotaxis protein CheW n=1 Tax=Azospirillum sp. BE72 TaxID=2817776 RepID=UPI00285FCEBF|nr:chemotaxis protein CheW [Azospirillum sp. BE72]MDR6772482.1 purine-binding chemotaxis protein CheW [Azospirillum sp. BE72]